MYMYMYYVYVYVHVYVYVYVYIYIYVFIISNDQPFFLLGIDGSITCLLWIVTIVISTSRYELYNSMATNYLYNNSSYSNSKIVLMIWVVLYSRYK
jgi:hypothetical protein